MWDLVGNLEDRFSHNEAQLITINRPKFAFKNDTVNQLIFAAINFRVFVFKFIGNFATISFLQNVEVGYARIM